MTLTAGIDAMPREVERGRAGDLHGGEGGFPFAVAGSLVIGTCPGAQVRGCVGVVGEHERAGGADDARARTERRHLAALLDDVVDAVAGPCRDLPARPLEAVVPPLGR